MKKNLNSCVIRSSDIDRKLLIEMYSLFTKYFISDQSIFEKDLESKIWIILLKNYDEEKLVGFSSIGFRDTQFKQKDIRVVYSGDTIIDRPHWNTFELPKQWIKTVLGKCKTNKPLYWLLLSSGFRTYKVLPIFYKKYFPRYNLETPSDIQNLMNHLGHFIYNGFYNERTGLVKFNRSASPLLFETAQVPESKISDPHVAFFLKKNPNYQLGDELVCLAEVKEENYSKVFKRMINK